MKFVLIGGTVEALLLSLKLSTDHEVFIVEMEAEIGLPERHLAESLMFKNFQISFQPKASIFYLFNITNMDGVVGGSGYQNTLLQRQLETTSPFSHAHAFSLINIQENITFSICPTTSVIFLIASRSIMLSQCPRTHSLALGNVVTPSISTTFNTTPFHPAVPGSVGRSPPLPYPLLSKRILFSHAATD